MNLWIRNNRIYRVRRYSFMAFDCNLNLRSCYFLCYSMKHTALYVWWKLTIFYRGIILLHIAGFLLIAAGTLVITLRKYDFFQFSHLAGWNMNWRTLTDKSACVNNMPRLYYTFCCIKSLWKSIAMQRLWLTTTGIWVFCDMNLYSQTCSLHILLFLFVNV